MANWIFQSTLIDNASPRQLELFFLSFQSSTYKGSTVFSIYAFIYCSETLNRYCMNLLSFELFYFIIVLLLLLLLLFFIIIFLMHVFYKHKILRYPWNVLVSDYSA